MEFNAHNFKQPAYKIEAPQSKRDLTWHGEIRYDLPFPATFTNLLYIAKATYNTWFTPSHYHDHFELCYIAEGSGWFSLEGVIYQVQQGDIFVTKPGEGHFGVADDGASYTLYAFGFHCDQMRDIESQYYKLGVQRIATDRDGRIGSECDRIIEEIREDRSFAFRSVQAHLIGLLVYVMRLYEQQTGGDSSGLLNLSPTIRQTLDLIHGDLRYMTKIDELARTVNLSRAQLDRDFKRYMGITLGAYMRSMCLERAKYCLRQSDDTVTAIADALRFESIHAFSVFFKRNTGFSPQQYRNLVAGRAHEEKC